jgi:crossover junction endodeoxyribonuclease RusA
MTADYTFYLPSPIALNTYYGHTGRVYLSERGKRFRDEVAWLARTQGAAVLEGELAVTVRVWNTKQDVDAGLKATLDALNGVAWLDDRQIKRLCVELLKDKGGRRMEVEVRKL